MARRRLLDPELLTEKRFCDLSPTPLAMAVLPWLPCFADREGRMVDDAFRIKLQILPTVDVDMEGILSDLVAKGFLRRYVVDGRRFIQLVDFGATQKPHPNETRSTIPPEPPPCVGSPKADHGSPKVDHGSPEEGAGVALTAGIRSGSGSGSRSDQDPSPPARVCDPGTAEPGTPPPPADPPTRTGTAPRLTGEQLLHTFGLVRNEVFPNTLPWDTARDPKGDAGTFAEQLRQKGINLSEVRRTMQLALEHIRDGVAGWNKEQHAKDPSFAFGAWKSGFHSLREELLGKAPPVALSAHEKSRQVLENWVPPEHRTRGGTGDVFENWLKKHGGGDTEQPEMAAGEGA